MQKYKSLRVEVMTSDILVNTCTCTQQLLTGYTITQRYKMKHLFEISAEVQRL